jgi:hypothetical protein
VPVAQRKCGRSTPGLTKAIVDARDFAARTQGEEQFDIA